MSDTTTTISISAAAFRILCHRPWQGDGRSFAHLIVQLEHGPTPTTLVGEVYPPRRDNSQRLSLVQHELCHELAAISHHLKEGGNVLFDGVELFTAILLLNAKEAERRAFAAASDFMINTAVAQPIDPESLTD